MKKVLVALFLLLLLAACSSQPNNTEEADENAPNDTNGNADTEFANAAIIYYSLTENTEEVAEEIQAQTEADLEKLEPVEPYPRAYSEVAGLVREQQEAGEFPELQDLDLNIEEYDTIFVGSPTWHGYISQPVQKWLMDTELADKNIIPFFTSGSQPIEDPQSDLRELLPEATITEELSMANSPRDDIEEEVSQWIENMEF